MKWERNPVLEHTLLKEMQESMHDDDRHQPSVSGMIYCVTKTYYENYMVVPNADGQLIPERSDSTLLLFATGLGLEKVLLSGRQVSEGGEYEGIQWHVDHYGREGFIEFKSTRASPRKDGMEPYSSEGWIKQIKAYCKVKGITTGHLVNLHLMGNRNPPFPTLEAWEFTLTQEEVDDNWDWIKSRANDYNEYVAAGTPPPPFKYNMDWECKDCSWLALCNSRKGGAW